MGEPVPFEHKGVRLYLADALDLLPQLAEESVDAVVTDPPYELGFMGRAWDASGIAYNVELWKHCLRVLKPGGHLLAFGGTRTWHRLACAVEDAGFEIRDTISWLYGSGFPKSLDVSKAIDKAAGAQREVVGRRTDGRYASGFSDEAKRAQGATAHDYSAGWVGDPTEITAPATDDARRWSGWGTALKPAHEPIVVARRPLSGTVAANVLAHGTGALNIDACRVGDEVVTQHGRGDSQSGSMSGRNYAEPAGRSWSGRWPSNVVLDDAAAAELDRQSGTLTSGANPTRRGADGDRTVLGTFNGQADANPQRGVDSGGASRFFPTFRYQAKAPTKERPKVDGVAHPTVKPLELMRWLVRLVTPAGGVVLDPFAGSGTTAEACILEGFACVTVDNELTHLPLIFERLNRAERPS